jgi:DNA-binding LacI/PurR family transcriptional regulator
MEKKPVTRRDIAQRADTSVSVVSRALNNSGYVAKEKKERILKIAEELNYIPNPVAASLQARRVRQILFYCKNMENAFNIQLYQGMLEEAGARGYMVLFCGQIAFEEIKNTLVDGIIMQDESMARFYLENEGKNYHLPVVSPSYGEPIQTGHAMPVVEIDTYRVMETALDYLWSLGHRKIAAGMPYPYESLNARATAYRSWMRGRGQKEAQKYFVAVTRRDPRLEGDERVLGFREETERSPYTVSEDFFGKGMLAARLFAERRLDATAVIGFNDDFALGMIRGFEQLGIRVPQDVSVMGIDGSDSRKYVSPLLTTISLQPRIQGAKCACVLLDMIEGKKYKYVNHTGFRLMEGESVRTLSGSP